MTDITKKLTPTVLGSLAPITGVKQVERWETSDGKVFATQEEAVDYVESKVKRRLEEKLIELVSEEVLSHFLVPEGKSLSASSRGFVMDALPCLKHAFYEYFSSGGGY